jgi:hypothetical protein
VRLCELSSGVDALYLSGYGDPKPDFLSHLEEARKLADLVHAPLSFRLGDKRFNLYPHGWGRYAYLLVGEMGSVGVTTSRHLPAIRVQPRSSLLHAIGAQATVARCYGPHRFGWYSGRRSAAAGAGAAIRGRGLDDEGDLSFRASRGSGARL